MKLSPYIFIGIIEKYTFLPPLLTVTGIQQRPLKVCLIGGDPRVRKPRMKPLPPHHLHHFCDKVKSRQCGLDQQLFYSSTVGGSATLTAL